MSKSSGVQITKNTDYSVKRWQGGISILFVGGPDAEINVWNVMMHI